MARHVLETINRESTLLLTKALCVPCKTCNLCSGTSILFPSLHPHRHAARSSLSNQYPDRSREKHGPAVSQSTAAFISMHAATPRRWILREENVSAGVCDCVLRLVDRSNPALACTLGPTRDRVLRDGGKNNQLLFSGYVAGPSSTGNNYSKLPMRYWVHAG